jgi:hypothetical protein
MKKHEIKVGKFYEALGMVVECLELGVGGFPHVPKFRVVWPIKGQERYIPARQIYRQLSDREVEAFQKKP